VRLPRRPEKPCKCAPFAIEKYMGRISGPLLDRIDLHIEVPRCRSRICPKPGDGTGSANDARASLRGAGDSGERFGEKAGGLNGRMTSKQIRTHCALRRRRPGVLKEAMESLGLSARAHDRILRVARTVAEPRRERPRHAGPRREAIGFRALDRKLWER